MSEDFEKNMNRGAIVVGCIGLCIACLMVSCKPVPAQTSHQFYGGACDSKGVCCYVYESTSISCVATRVEIIVSPGEVKDELKPEFRKEPQRFEENGGEVQGRALEARLSEQYPH